MKYENAKDLLPKELFEELQRHAAGKLLYVPSQSGRRPWGESTGYRRLLGKRNAEIRRKFTEGASIDSLADEYFLTPETVKKIVYLKKEKNTMELNEIYRLYSNDEPLNANILRERKWLDDPEQYIIEAAVTYPDKKICLRVFCYCFATPERIAQAVRMIDAYRAQGYSCPKIVPNIYGELCRNVKYNGYDCIVYAYEWADGERAAERDGALPCFDELLELGAKIASLRLDGDQPNCMTLFDPATACGAYEDYVVDYFCGDLKEQISGDYPSLKDKYAEAARLFSENRDALRPLWKDLPSSLFPADLTWSTFTDGGGNLAYITDLEDGGREPCVDFFVRASLDLQDADESNACEEVYDGRMRERRTERFIGNFMRVAGNYDFSDAEIAAAPLIYKIRLIGTLYYWQIADFAAGDPDRLSDFFDYLKTQLTTDEIDFEEIMR